MALQCNCKKKLPRYDVIILFVAVPAPARLFGPRNSNRLFRAIAKFSRDDGFVFFAVPAPALLFWVIVVCTVSVFIPIENPHLTIVHFGKTPRV